MFQMLGFFAHDPSWVLHSSNLCKLCFTVAQIKELEEKLEEVERQKQEEEESRRKVELAFDEYKREIETRDAQLLETNK